MVIGRLCRVSGRKQPRHPHFTYGRGKKKRRKSEPKVELDVHPKQYHRMKKWQQQLAADKTYKVPVTVSLPPVQFLLRKLLK
jgi:hypothetical protein